MCTHQLSKKEKHATNQSHIFKEKKHQKMHRIRLRIFFLGGHVGRRRKNNAKNVWETWIIKDAHDAQKKP